MATDGGIWVAIRDEWVRQQWAGMPSSKITTQASIMTLELSTRVTSTLIAEGIHRVEQLLLQSPEELMAMRWIGYNSVLAIERQLAKCGLGLATALAHNPVSQKRDKDSSTVAAMATPRTVRTAMEASGLSSW